MIYSNNNNIKTKINLSYSISIYSYTSSEKSFPTFFRTSLFRAIHIHHQQTLRSSVVLQLPLKIHEQANVNQFFSEAHDRHRYCHMSNYTDIIFISCLTFFFVCFFGEYNTRIHMRNLWSLYIVLTTTLRGILTRASSSTAMITLPLLNFSDSIGIILFLSVNLCISNAIPNSSSQNNQVYPTF